MVSISLSKQVLKDVVGDVLVVVMCEGELKGSVFTHVDGLVGGGLSAAIAHGDFTGKAKDLIMLPVSHGNVKRVVVCGVGKRGDVAREDVYAVLAQASMAGQKKKSETYVFVCSGVLMKKLSTEGWARLVTRALVHSTYHFDRYISNVDAKLLHPVSLVFALCEDEGVCDMAQKELIVCESVNWTRELGNHPAGDMTPKHVSQLVKEQCKDTEISVRVLNEDAMRELGMGGMLGVSKGSHEEAQMVLMEYKGGKKGEQPIVFCGKGITFDSGGISIKPSSKMDEMKFDMLGAATVAGGVLAIAKLGLKVNVVGILACAENLPSGSALRPGDVITAYNKKTIEVLNTDAEGRLVLADALSYAKKYDPLYVVDFATLTGACIVALGMEYAGLFAPTSDMRDRLLKASRISGDKVWELPVTPEYSEHIKSKVADVKNVGRSGQAGASSAAAFLKEFVDYPWAHIDMACAWDMSGSKISHAGATGFGVHLMVALVS